MASEPLKHLCHARASFLLSLNKESLGKDPGKAGVKAAEERREGNRDQRLMPNAMILLPNGGS